MRAERTEYLPGDFLPGSNTEPPKPKLSQPFTWDQLLAPVDQEDTLLGKRLLERGSGFLLFGPSGCGKSVAADQACAEWSAGLPGLHIQPPRPLKIVILQTEDSLNDIRENLAGILSSSVFGDKEKALVKENLIILPAIAGGNPEHLTKCLTEAAKEYQPDLIHLNPLLAFCDRDPTRELGGLLYQNVDPVIKHYHLGFFGVHHTPKTLHRDTSGYGVHDFQYMAAGDARIANWPRAMISIEEVAWPIYRFRLAKRWDRSGWTWDGQPVKERFFRHNTKVVRWDDVSPEEAAKAVKGEDYTRILDILPKANENGISRDRLRDLAKNQLDAGRDKADSWLRLATEDDLVETIPATSEHNRKIFLYRRSSKELFNG